MKRTYAQATTRSISVTKLVGGVAAVGLHLLVLGMVFLVPSNDMVEPSLDEGTEVYFVELADVVGDAAHIAVEQPVVDVEAPLEPVVEAPLVEPEQAEVPPEQVPEPEPVVALKPQPLPKQRIKPPVKPAAKPVARPPPVAVPKEIQAPAQATQTVASVPPANTPSTTSPSARQDNQPRMVSTVDYLGKRPMPVYPRASQRRQEQGRVVVRVLISPQGSVLDVQVHSSSGFERLDQAAVKAARSARFKPYTENGIAYRAMADLPFDFVL